MMPGQMVLSRTSIGMAPLVVERSAGASTFAGSDRISSAPGRRTNARHHAIESDILFRHRRPSGGQRSER